MKHLLASLLTISLLAACTNIPPVTNTPSPTAPDIDLDRIFPDMHMFRDGLAASAQHVPAAMKDAPVYNIRFELSDDLIHVQGHEDVWYTNREDVPLNEIQFRLFSNILGGKMTVSNLTVHETPVTPRYGLNNSLMIVPLAKPLEVGQYVPIRMDFTLEVPTDVELNFGVQAYYNGVLALAHAYPMLAVHDDEGWNAELPPQAGDVTYADASFFLVSVRAPEDVTVVASGAEYPPTIQNGQMVQTVAIGPARDFFLAASRDFQVESQTLGEVTVNSYATTQFHDGSVAALEAATSAMETFSDTYGAYPYREFDVVCTPTLALGVEYPGLTVIADRIYTDEAYGSDTFIIREATVVHEVAHQWFYNLVGNDQLDEPWLDESLAQFVTWEYYRIRDGANGAAGFEGSLRERWTRVDDQPIPIGQPVAAYQGREYGAIVYGRGALFLDVLRDEMGQDAFDDFLRAYVETHAWNIATTPSFKALAEEHCSCDLTSLFEEWVY